MIRYLIVPYGGDEINALRPYVGKLLCLSQVVRDNMQQPAILRRFTQRRFPSGTLMICEMVKCRAAFR